MKRLFNISARALLSVALLAACGGGGGGGGGAHGSLVTTSSVFHVPDTGQTACYDDSGLETTCTGTGQDGDYTIYPPSYTDNGDGTIRDNVTGLTWQKCSVGQSDPLCSTGTASGYNWYQAAGAYDATYNAGSTNVCGSLTLAGGGWRLPTDFELTTIADFGTDSPSINTTYFPNTPSSSYWSSDICAPPGETHAWNVAFISGSDTGFFDMTYGFYVRCVRGRTTVFGASFKDNGSGTVTDLTTNLMWQQCSAGLSTTTAACDTGTAQGYIWNDAISYCEGLSLGGFTDWRLPNIRELKSIVDLTTLDPAINTAYFPNTQTLSFYLSSTSYASSPTYARGVYFASGGDGGGTKAAGGYVRCVRGK